MRTINAMLFTCLMIFSANTFAEPADVLKVDENMWMGFDAEGVVFYYHDYMRVETNSVTGVIKYSSHGYVDANAILPEKTMKFGTGHLGYTCAGDAPYLRFVVTPSGRASLKCQNWPFQDE